MQYPNASPPASTDRRLRPCVWRTLAIAVSSSLCIALSSAIARPVVAAERLRLRVGPFEQTVWVRDLERFAETGEIAPSLQRLRPLLTPKLRELLGQRLQIDDALDEDAIATALETPEIERLLRQLGVAFPETSISLLQEALESALQEFNGLNAISFLRAYPEPELVIDATAAIGIVLQLNTAYLHSQILGPVLERELEVESAAGVRFDFDPAVAQRDRPVYEQTLILQDYERQRVVTVDIYYSDVAHGPTIVMSHGFAADRKFLAYLGVHLASYGFTTVAIEHPGSNVRAFVEMPVGLDPSSLLSASEFIDRPRDVSFVLDELEQLDRYASYWDGKFNRREVVAIGHSLGGYTALALAGGELDLRALRRFCRDISPLGRSPADWLQCAAADLPHSRVQLRDRRIKRAIALNPMVGQMFGKDGLQRIEIPIVLFSSSDDAITPTLVHQLQPFKQLQGEKYLLAATGGTHMSVTDIRNLDSPMGRNTLVQELMGSEAEPIRTFVRGTSLAFIQQMTPAAARYRQFLTPAYAQSLSTSELELRLTTKLPTVMDAWLQSLHTSQRLIVQRTEPLFPRLRWHWPVAIALSWRRNSHPHCTEQLHQTFSNFS